MKKLFSAFTAVLLAFCFISCAPQELSDRSSKNEGSVSLSIRSPRTISPAEGISYKDVEVWNVTFRDIDAKYDDIEKTVLFIGSESQEIRLPVGTYDVIFEGSVTKVESDDTTVEVPFYGKDSVTVVEGKTVPISVFVAPKKSEGETGSFNFTVNISGLKDFPDSVFESKLIPYSQGEEQSLSPTFSDSILTVTSQSIPSGFYKLSIKYKTSNDPLEESKEIFYPYHDFLVEIVDGLETKGSADITVSFEESKTYYATTDATKAKGNGAFASMPGYLDDVLAAIKDTTISTANIIMVDSLAADGTTIYPEIDVSKVNATGVCYSISVINPKGGVTYCYSIKDEDGDGNLDIYTEADTINLTDSSAAGKTVDVYNIVELKELHLSLKNNTSVAIKFVVQGPVILDEIDSFDYYSTHPFMTAEYQISDLYLSSTLEELYTTASKTISASESASEYEYYILPAGQDNPTINGIAYNLVATKNGQLVTNPYVGDTVTITATSESEDGSFTEGTSFTWFINGKQYGDSTTEPWCEITIGAEGNNTDTYNTIICLVGYEGEYSTKSIVLTAQEKTIVLYNKTSYTNKPALSYAALTNDSVSSLTTPLLATTNGTEIVDYCFDNLNNLYAIVKNTGTATNSINKYTYNNGYNKNDVTTYIIGETEDVSAISYIEASSDGELYAVMTNTDYMTYIAQLTLTEPTTEANGTVSFTTYNVPTDWPQLPNIKTFCTDGTNFYVIVSITSYDDMQSEIQTVKLVSCTVSGENQLVENKSILLASTAAVEGDTPVFSVSEYNDALEYKDLCYINDKLYLLVRDVQISSSSQEYDLISRGELRIFDVSGTGITARESGIGYQTASSTISYQQNGSTMKRTTFFGDSNSKLFYGPVKFIARKEDELLIADDGYCVDSSANVNTKNNIVKVNLKTESITGSYNLDSGYFDYYYSGQFGSSICINGYEQ
ncbi:MAG: hypothetical protein ACI4LT_00335 [Treponema sp.]